MSPLASELARAKRQQELDAFVAAEKAMESRIAITRPPISEADKATLAPFARWAAQNNVRHCPVRPHVLAVYLAQCAHLGGDQALSFLKALAALHDQFGFSNPTASAGVMQVLNSIIPPVEPPRSWKKEEKILFKQLPPPIQAVVARREQDRESALRKIQNRSAEVMKGFIAGARSKVGELTKQEMEIITMAKTPGWKKGEGPYSDSSKVKIVDGDGGLGPAFDKSRDISKAVDKQSGDGRPGPVSD